jgi:hypothetical protein
MGGLIHRLQIPFRTWRAKTNPERRLAQAVMTVQRDAYAGRTDPTLIERLEAQLAAADMEARKVFAKYPSEPP